MTSLTMLWRRRAAVGIGAVLALTGGSLVVPAQAEPLGPIDCPAPVPAASITVGMVGTGYTVVKGTTPEPFTVEVLGVLADGLGAGQDMVVIKVSDLPEHHVVDQGGGIWAGMSGSPVYVNGQLLGAVSYGFTLAPSPLGGLTPAADMVKLLNLPTTAAPTAPTPAPKASVTLPKHLRIGLAARAGVAAPRGTLQQLPTPLSVSGLTSRRLGRLQSDAEKAGRPFLAYAGSSHRAPAAIAPSSRPVPGGNFAAALSYGDVTFAGIGTTTAVCGDQALAFGHPMQYAGPVSYGANNANALTIVKDDTLGSFKMASLGADFGTVDQDRRAGLRANLGAVPSTADITVVVKNTDTQKSRVGTTRVVDQTYLPALTAYSIWGDYDAAFDEYGDGRAATSWTINGTRAGGVPFSVSRSNQFASLYSVTDEPAFEPADAADALVNNDYEAVHITGVTFSSTVSTVYQQLHVTKVEASVNGGKYSTRALKLKVGDKLKVRVSKRPYRSTTTTTSTLSLTVPKKARGMSGSLTVTGGDSLGQSSDWGDSGCLLTGEGCGDSTEGSLDKVISSITSPARNDDLVASLNVESDSSSATSSTKTTARQPSTIAGRKSLEVSVKR